MGLTVGQSILKAWDPDTVFVEKDGKSVIDHAATAERNAKSEEIAGKNLNDSFVSPGAVVAAGLGVAGVATANPILLYACFSWLAFRGVDLLVGIKNLAETRYHQARAGADALKID